eukprot:gene9717-11517_t
MPRIQQCTTQSLKLHLGLFYLYGTYLSLTKGLEHGDKGQGLARRDKGQGLEHFDKRQCLECWGKG